MFSLKDIEDQPEELCLEIVTIEPMQLKYVKNKTRLICETAVSRCGEAIKFIENPDEDLCWLALEQDALAIGFLSNPSYEMIDFALERTLFPTNQISNIPIDLIIKNDANEDMPETSKIKIQNYLKTLPEEAVFPIVEEYPILFALVDNPSYELTMMALDKHPDNIAAIANPTLEMLELVMGRTVYIFRHVNRQDTRFDYEGICFDALKKWNSAILFIDEPTEEMKFMSLQYSAAVFELYYSEELAWEALKRNPCWIGLVVATQEMLEYVLETRPKDLRFYHGPFEEEFFLRALERVPELIFRNRAENIPEDLAWRIIKQIPKAIEYIDNVTPEMEAYVVDRKPHLIKLVNATEDLCWNVLRKDPKNIRFIENIATKEMFYYALERTPAGLSYVEQTEENIELALACNPDHTTDVIDRIIDPYTRLAYRKKYASTIN